MAKHKDEKENPVDNPPFDTEEDDEEKQEGEDEEEEQHG